MPQCRQPSPRLNNLRRRRRRRQCLLNPGLRSLLSFAPYAAADVSNLLTSLRPRKCLKFYSDQHVDVKKYEKLNSWIMAVMIGDGDWL